MLFIHLELGVGSADDREFVSVCRILAFGTGEALIRVVTLFFQVWREVYGFADTLD
jgi:hypothetical protein